MFPADDKKTDEAPGGRPSPLLVFLFVTLGLFAALLWAAGQSRGEDAIAPITPLAPLPTDPAKVALGAELFRDVRLSGDGKKACETCHSLAKGGTNTDVPPARSGPHEGFDTPSVFNAALNYRFNWLGEHRTLAEANEESILDPGIMAADWRTVLATLRNDPALAKLLRASYGAEWNKNAVLDALAEFQRSLVTADSRFDLFLKGQPDAITVDEERGYRLFEGLGCVACHQGRNVGGNLMQRFGVFASSERRDRKAVRKTDLGRFSLTKLESDRFVFRVPSLRNVAVTGPYLHDGSVSTLEEVVAIMARTQLGRELSKSEIGLVAKFLRTLTGRYRGVPLGEVREGEPR